MASPIPEQFPALRIRTRHCRIHVDYPQVAARLGECTEDENGIPHGISGWEKEFDRELSGSAGTFSVMRDRKAGWLPGTIRMNKMPSPGKDITLDVSKRVRELLEKKGYEVFDSKANYLFFKGPEDLYDTCLNKGVLIRDCSNYDGLKKGWYRVTIRCPKDNEKLLSVL